MTLEQLSLEAGRATGNVLGFVIKSLAHPERKFRVCYKFASGKFGITRLDTGADYLVGGDSDRYDFVIPVARIIEVKAEMAGLTARLAELDAVMGGLTATGAAAATNLE